MPLGIDFTQIFLHLFNVIILFGGLYYLLYAPVKNFMKTREDYYKNREEETGKQLEEAREQKEEYAARLAKVDEEIRERQKEAEGELARAKREQKLAAETEAKNIISRAKQEATEQKARIIDSARGDISELIEEAARKMMLEETTSELFDAFLGEAERSVEHGV